MPHAFDTGLATEQLTLVQDGVVELLSPLLVANGGYLRAVKPFGGLIRSYQDEVGIDAFWSELTGAQPAILVGLGDLAAKAAGMGGFNFAADLELVLYHCNQHQASITTGRSRIDARAAADNTRNPGLLIARAHARELVIGQRVGGTLATNAVGEKRRSTPSIKQIEIVREEELRTDKTITLWAQRFSVKITLTINPKRGVTQMLEELRTVVRPSDAAAEDIQPEDQDRPGDVVIESQNEPHTP